MVMVVMVTAVLLFLVFTVVMVVMVTSMLMVMTMFIFLSAKTISHNLKMYQTTSRSALDSV